MKSYSIFIAFVMIALSVSTGLGQRSCVFLNEDDNAPTNDRPPATLKFVRPLASLDRVSITASAPDFPNIDVSNYFGADQDETSIAINPTNPNNLILGANDYRSDSSLFHYESFDGGKTWTEGSLNTNWVFAASPTDPAIAFNSGGTAFYSYGRLTHDASNPYPLNDVICNVTNDGGKTWKLPVRVFFDSISSHAAKTFADKFYIAVDKEISSPYHGRIYVCWSEFDENKNARIRVSYSVDNGLHWSTPSYINPTSGHYQSAIPAIGASGEVHIVYANLDPAQKEILIASSLDGGASFPVNHKISNYLELGPIYPVSNPLGHPTIKSGLRVNSFPAIAVDHSALHLGRIYITWTALGGDNKPHIYFTLSDDIGNHWSAVKAIENDTSIVTTDKFFPWISVDDITGDVGIACYDSRADTANILTDLFMFFSNNGGATFTSRRISGESFDTRNNSVIGTDLPYFFGDYIGLASHNKMWYPAWTDSRSGYDQDVFISIVRPYAPTAPRDFVAIEDDNLHVAHLRWQHLGLSTFGLPMSNYSFLLKRSDDGFQVSLPSSSREFIDSHAVASKAYTYYIQTVSQDGDTSVTANVNFNPYGARQSMAPEIVSARAVAGGMIASSQVPSLSVGGSKIHSLKKLYFFIDGNILDTVNITDSLRGKTLDHLFSFAEDGYRKIQLVALTRQDNGDTTLSPLSSPVWIYSGSPLSSYSEDFSHSKNIFSPFAWDTTRAGGTLPSTFINDSLPNVAYPHPENTWFLLPPVSITSETKTLEFSDIALVATGDSCVIEVSTDDGVHFTPLRFYDKSHSTLWTNSLSSSSPVHEMIGLKAYIGNNVIARFRMATHNSDGDGWFIDSIGFSSALKVEEAGESSAFRVSLVSNPIHTNSRGVIKLFSDQTASLTINMYSTLGVKAEALTMNQRMNAGESRFEFTLPHPGCYFYEVIARTNRGEERRYGSCIVVP
ncbi:MAG: sialidase family protein [bacterium]